MLPIRSAKCYHRLPSHLCLQAQRGVKRCFGGPLVRTSWIDMQWGIGFQIFTTQPPKHGFYHRGTYMTRSCFHTNLYIIVASSWSWNNMKHLYSGFSPWQRDGVKDFWVGSTIGATIGLSWPRKQITTFGEWRSPSTFTMVHIKLIVYVDFGNLYFSNDTVDGRNAAPLNR